MPFTVIPIVNTSPLHESPWNISGVSRDSSYGASIYCTCNG